MLGQQCPFSPSVPAEAGSLFTVAAGVHVFISGESLHCFLVGWCTNKSYVIATSDLWLFMLPTCFPLNSPLQNLALASRIGSRRVTDRPGDSVAELSGGTGRQWRGAVGRYWDSVAELSGTEAVRGNLTTELHLHWWLIYNYSNRIQSFTRCSQPRQPSPTWRNAPRGRWCSSTLDGSWRMGSSVVGRLTNVALPFNCWFFPAHFSLTQERSGATSASARDALWCHALGKKEGDMMLGMVVR